MSGSKRNTIQELGFNVILFTSQMQNQIAVSSAIHERELVVGRLKWLTSTHARGRPALLIP